jgi:hypothetical protein
MVTNNWSDLDGGRRNAIVPEPQHGGLCRIHQLRVNSKVLGPRSKRRLNLRNPRWPLLASQLHYEIFTSHRESPAQQANRNVARVWEN